MSKRGRDLAKGLMVKAHQSALRAGIVALPNHFYTPIADVNELARTQEVWAHRSSMTGIEVDLERQAARLRELVQPFEPEYRDNLAFKDGQAKGYGPGFGYIEAQCLHGVLRGLKPKRIIEVGSGVSTYCTLKAIELNAAEGHPAEITCIEPFPSSYLQDNPQINLIRRKVEEVDPAEFDKLERGDFLFIDTSHAVKPCGDVVQLYLEVLPRIKPGCVIHIHDIYFPYPFQRDLLHGLFQHMESAFLQAVLAHNNRLEILFSLSMLHYDSQETMRDVFPEYRPAVDVNGLSQRDADGHFPSSIYLRVLG